jgi:streptogramin lyase
MVKDPRLGSRVLRAREPSVIQTNGPFAPLPLLACLCLLCAGLLAGTTAASASQATHPVPADALRPAPAGTTATGGAGALVGEAWPLEGPLVATPGWGLEGEQRRAGEEARLAGPLAVAKREVSQTAYEDLDAGQTANLTRKAFPDIVEHAAGGAPQLQSGSIASYLTDYAAEVKLGDGARGIIESAAPIALGTSRRHVPIDLSLVRAEGAYEPQSPMTSVRIAKRLSGGVALPRIGVSLTPVNAHGAALAGSGTVDGAAVLYANTQTDADALVKPTTGGFELDTLLRAADSPHDLYFEVGLPAGASLRRDGASGSLKIVEEGVTIATIRNPIAQDAAGTPVPVAMSVAGDRLALKLGTISGKYEFPIDVDPQVEISDSQLVTTSGGKRSNWEFHTTSEAKFGHRSEGGGKEFLETSGIGEYKEAEYAYWGYQTKGISKIFEFNSETEAKNKGNKIESFLELEAKGTGAQENKEMLSNEFENPEYLRRPAAPICPKNVKGEQECLPTAGGEGNAVHFQQSVTRPPEGHYQFSDTMFQGVVEISEAAGTHSKAKFNTSSPEVEGEVEEEGKKVKQKRPNALYGSGGWLSKYQDALQPEAEDPGIGVAATKMEYESAGKWELLGEHNYLEQENGCKGVQCYEKHSEYWTVAPQLPNGEDKLRYRAKEAVNGTESTETEGIAKVKVDTAPPHRFYIQNLPYGSELTERPYELTVEATDGEGSTIASSGIRSIAFYVDGHERTETGKQTDCSVPAGECTASAKYIVNGAELGAGHHSIEIVAFDNAGNEARHFDQISVRHSTPVALGPGSVDLESGDFSLGAKDVSLGSGLTVSRTYSSRATEQGDEGPLGPQWTLGLASTDSLTELSNGDVMMTSANGSQMIFANLGEGKFESPPADSNLTLRLEENKTTKAKEAYYLEDAADHTEVKFILPSGGTRVWVPTVQEGAVPTDTVTYKYRTASSVTEYPVGSSWTGGIAVGPNNALWSTGSGAVDEIPISGTPVSEFPLPSKAEVSSRAIVEGPDGNEWFTTAGNVKKVGKITPSGAVTEYSLPGEKHEAFGITVGPDGNIWFAMKGWENSGEYIAKITPAGVITTYQISGEAGQLTPGPNGEQALYYTDGLHGRIGKITMSGVVTEYQLSGVAPANVVAGPDGKIWYTDSTGARIGKISTTGTGITEYTVPGGGATNGITVGPDGNLWFTETKGRIGKISTTGTITEYSGGLPESVSPAGITTGPDGKLWFSEGNSNKIGTITTSGTITEPTEVRAPIPSGVVCSWTSKPTEMNPGCRALEFKYATETTATGEAESEWGEYNRRLTKVSAVAYSPSAKEMKEIPVAEYKYDKLGRLRATWDPRIEKSSACGGTCSALKTRYGYDSEGHVTALNPPGQEPWSFTYGTGKGDTGSGRLLKLTLAPKSTSLWGGGKLSNTEAPKVTGSPSVGTRLAVSNGAWSGGPLTYGYQWQDCDAESHCTPILAADNANYTPTEADIGHTLVAQVTATSGWGSVTVASTATAPVTASSVTQAIDTGNSINAASCIPGTTNCVVSDSKGNLYRSSNVGVGSSATWSAWSGPGTSPSQALNCPTTTLCLLAAGKEAAGGKLYYATTLGGSWLEAYSPSYGVDAISCASASFCVDGQDGLGYFRYSTNPASTSWSLEEQGSAQMTAVSCLSSSFCAMSDANGNVYIATSTTQIESSAWKTTDVDGTSPLNGVACTSTTSCVAVDGFGNVLGLAIAGEGKATATTHNIDGTTKLTAVTCTGSSTCATVDTAGNIFVSTNSGETWTKQLRLGDNLTSVSCASTSLCLAADTSGFVTAFNPTGGGGTEGELHSPGPGTTLEYDVPVTGTGAPHDMSEAEITKWGQSREEAPVEATAIVPPDSPQGWPASSYGRASVYYLDELGRSVNVAQPSAVAGGSIATTEYNEYNDVVRTLAPGNRTTALASGSKSAEVANLLSTISQYNEPQCRKESSNKEKEIAEPGTRLCETWGPQHMVKYVAGKEQKESLARDHTKYFYEDAAHGAPEGEKFDLVTETTDLALLANEEEVEVRKTSKSYSGQGGLGWKLRAPTSVTTDPEGLKLTSTTEYNSETGQIKETHGVGEESTLTYATKFGEAGSEPGKFSSPSGVAIDSSGNLYVVDQGNNRVEKFDPEGKLLAAFGKTGTAAGELKEPRGIAIDSHGNLYVAEAGNSRIQKFSPEGTSLQLIGKKGTGAGKLKEPSAVAIDAAGNIFVADTGNNRVQEFSPEGTSIKTVGKLGSEPGQFKEPQGIALDASGNILVADTGNNRIQKLSPEGTPLTHFGELGSGAGQFKAPEALVLDSAGHIWVADQGNSRAQELAASGAFITQFGRKGSGTGQLNEPRALAVDAGGNVWLTDTANNRLEKFAKGPNAHDSKIIYYTAQENKDGYPGCGKRPEWSGLVCEALPVKQPELAAIPTLPVTTTTYNVWNEPEKVEEAFTRVNAEGKEEASMRTKTNSYDEAGRLTSSETTATGTTDLALPKVTDEYNKTTGLLEKESAPIGGTTKTITSVRNTLGQLESYTDSEGNTAKYKYAGPEGDELLEEMSDSSNKGESSQKYTYDETTKKLTKLVDSAAGTFTAGYDVEGQLTSEVYPNEMCANLAHSSVGEVTHIEYIKSSNCSNKGAPVWFGETRTPSIRGEMMSRESTLSKETYNYDTAGRLLETRETPTGEFCKTRLYTYDEMSDRLSSTTREPNSKKECAGEGGVTQGHDYDEGSRLIDPGTEYDSFGNATKLPAADAEGQEIKSTFYVNGAVATQEQNGSKNEYLLDPLGRTRETTAGTKKIVAHYDAPGEAVSWSCEKVAETCEGSGKWSRNIPGIDGALTAIQTNGATPVLQLHDLEGNIVATASLNPAETKLLSTYDSTEFGVPTGGKTPPPFAWLGANDVASSLPTGVITYGATSYIPQTGRALQSEEVAPPGAPAGTGAGAPVEFQEEPWNMQGAGREAAEAPGLEAGREREAQEAACRANPEACSEDPAWSGDVSIPVASGLSGALEGIELVNAISGQLAEKVLEDLADFLDINWLSQLKEVIQKGLFGYSYDEVTHWAFTIGTLLDTCTKVTKHYTHPHCWLYLPTVVRHAYRGGPGFEIPNFAAPFGWENPEDVAVGYCPFGRYSRCYNANAI